MVVISFAKIYATLSELAIGALHSGKGAHVYVDVQKVGRGSMFFVDAIIAISLYLYLERVFLVATIFLTSMILLDVFPSIVLLG
jgi:hypothetical protein